MRPEILVIGAGISGLTTAVCLAEAGLAVYVRTRHLPDATTSCAAGAIWGPYLVDDDRVVAWSDLTRSTLDGLAAEAGTGVRLVYGLEAGRSPTDPPAWAKTLDGFRDCDPRELPEGYASGWWYTAPIIDMPVYLSYLVRRLGEAGVGIAARPVASLAEAVAEAPITVNCAGVGARRLVPDAMVTPTRGQIVVVDNPGIGSFFVEHEESPEPTYYLPHGDHLVLGGSAEAGRVDLAPDLAVSAAIRRRCIAVEPAIATARVRAHRVGLRPSRPTVRVERTVAGGRHLIHNYGHGGAGVTLSWGCARDVLAMISEL